MKLANNHQLNFWQACVSSALIVFSLLLPASGEAACKVNAFELPATIVEGRAIVTVGINGSEVPLAVDSGAFFSFLTRAAAAQLQLRLTSLPYGFDVQGLVGGVDARMTTVKKLQLLNGEIPNVDFIVGGNQIGGGAMGLLGRNLLAAGDTEYDLAHGVIRLMFPQGDCGDSSMAYWAGETPVVELPLVIDDRSKVPAIKAVAKLNDRKIEVVFDTGAYSIVSLEAAGRAGVSKADMKPADRIYGLGRGNAESWTAAFQKFQLGGEAVANFHLHVGDFDQTDFDMLLGIDFFLSHRIYVSKKQHRMYITYNGGPIFPLDQAAIQAAAASKGVASEPSATEQPVDADVYARSGAAAAARGDFAKALADLDRACAMAPQMAAYFVRRGVVHEAMKQRPQALQDFDKALQLEPTQSEALMHRALLRLKAGDRDGTLSDLQLLDQSLPVQSDQRLAMATLYRDLGLRDLALPQWTLWITAHPNDVGLDDALYSRCWTRVLLNVQLDQALEDCNKALDLQSKNAGFLSGRAWLYLRRGELRKSLTDFDRAVKIRPERAWSLYGRGIARRKNGDAVQGDVDIEAARKLLPSIDAKAGLYGLNADPVSSLQKDGSPSPDIEADRPE